MTDGNQELFDAVAAEPEEVVDLTTIRRKAVELRDTYFEKAELEERVKKLDGKITDIERKDLPDMFSKAKISSVPWKPTAIIRHLSRNATRSIPLRFQTISDSRHSNGLNHKAMAI